jgi:kynurenine formamidase
MLTVEFGKYESGLLLASWSVADAALCFGFALSARAQDVSRGRWIDLIHPFNSETVYWPTAKTFGKETVFAGHTEGGYYYTAYNFAAAEHGGTHLDAPMMTRNIPAFEDVADMSELPPIGATIIALPTKIKGGSGGPLRIIARLPGG